LYPRSHFSCNSLAKFLLTLPSFCPEPKIITGLPHSPAFFSPRFTRCWARGAKTKRLKKKKNNSRRESDPPVLNPKAKTASMATVAKMA
jgi:hypothetical protein